MSARRTECALRRLVEEQREEIGRVVDVAGEAIGTDKDLRSTACVDVLADHCRTLRSELVEARALLKALGDALETARATVHRWTGDIEDPNDHWDECPAYDEDAYDWRIHEADCPEHPGERVRLVPRGWYESEPCCEQDFDRDEEEMSRICVCSLGALWKVEHVATEALRQAGLR